MSAANYDGTILLAIDKNPESNLEERETPPAITTSRKPELDPVTGDHKSEINKDVGGSNTNVESDVPGLPTQMSSPGSPNRTYISEKWAEQQQNLQNYVLGSLNSVVGLTTYKRFHRQLLSPKSPLLRISQMSVYQRTPKVHTKATEQENQYGATTPLTPPQQSKYGSSLFPNVSTRGRLPTLSASPAAPYGYQLAIHGISGVAHLPNPSISPAYSTYECKPQQVSHPFTSPVLRLKG
ncbi:uncharacterized protein BDR25DRAFT_313157 [Lindgomyces ingoldianus]|uniref:Uncharacterized protein n=1 Tax=Lindgomyces ingoldianus TaxID=673940 RepID=A0ACB6QY45_9PLEO|nr:uncharacterized protein BDR25DRAFT_313157 [Lindgomyces ingoldianus]KAF2471933.1 hypothetical protein BDR25DRAFT_313157 [Lindgomyces ingoldianus]